MDQSPERILAPLAYLLLIPSIILVKGISGPVLTLAGLAGTIYLALQRYGLIKFNIRDSFKGAPGLGRETEKLNRASKILILCYLLCLMLVLLKFMVQYSAFISLDQMFIMGLLGAFLVKKGRSFLWDWVPFVMLIIAYDAMRGVADNLAGEAHYMEPIIAEKLLFFGTLPTTWAQNHLYSSVLGSFYAGIALFFYSTHFLSLIFFAYLLWINEKSIFSRYKTAIILVSYAGLITFMLYPVAPPWLAVQKGLIPPLANAQDGHPPAPSAYLDTIYLNFNANNVAAIPSLHIAYPWLIFLYCLKWLGRKAFPVIILPLGVGFGAVYLGHHYVVDLIIGVVYATAAYLAVERLIK